MSASAQSPLIIIGTGLAGYNLAKEFRKLNTETPLCLITSDDGSSYSKPMLSNAFAKNKTPESLVIASAEKMASDLAAKVLTRTVVRSIDSKNKTVTLDSGESLHYSKLVMATGALPINPPLEGNAAADVYIVNSLEHYAAFYPEVASAETVAIIGPGLIGCEFANDLATQGKRVTVIGPDTAPLGRLLPQQAGEYMLARLNEQGIEFKLQTVVKQIDKQDSQYQLLLDTGETVIADIVLSAIGLIPNTELAKAAGLEVNRGIVVDRNLRTSTEDVYALGDCMEINGLVLPFIMPIMHASRALAKTLTNEVTEISFPAMPVLVKTPACPTIVSPPARGAEGEWHVEASESGVNAKFMSPANELLGFALLGDATSEKQTLTKGLPAILN